MGKKLSEILYCIKKESLGSISELKRLFSFCIRLEETGNPLRAGTGLSCVYIQPRPIIQLAWEQSILWFEFERALKKFLSHLVEYGGPQVEIICRRSHS